jgi:hypothetical protein
MSLHTGRRGTTGGMLILDFEEDEYCFNSLNFRAYIELGLSRVRASVG